MSTRFDFEQQIMSCWSVCDDLKAIETITDVRQLSEDEMLNLLIGIRSLYQIKFENLFAMFEEMIQNGSIK